MMIDSSQERAENREEKQGDRQVQTQDSLGNGDFASAGRRIVAAYRLLAAVTFNTLILLVFAELAATAILRIPRLFPASTEQLVGEGAPREKNSYYASKDWAARYWYEFRLSRRVRYYPYIGWRRESFSGQTINVDQHGIRLTPGADCNTNAYKVFVFGGSTIWGTGSPDRETIPAYLQAGIGALTTRPVCVVNFGESAYVSTQSLILLVRQLQSGNIPDVVLFYDGVNDIYAAYQSGQAGVHQNLHQIASKLDHGGSSTASPFTEWLRGLSSVALFKNVIAGPKQDPQENKNLVTYETLKVDRAGLSESMARTYLANYKVVNALAHDYGFKYDFFWQPVIVVGKKHLTDEEQAITASLDPALVALYTSLYDIIEHTAPHYENLHYMGHIFDEQNSGIWIDDMHITPVGNRIVAEEMLRIVKNAEHFSG
jgi:hypothetical protein